MTKDMNRFAPDGGWKPSTYYVVEVAFSASNVPHRAIYYSGFLNGPDKSPGGYSGLFNPTYDPSFMASPELFSMKVVCEIPEMARAA